MIRSTINRVRHAWRSILYVVAWNCYVGNSPTNVRAALTSWATMYPDLHVFALSEAASHYSTIRGWARGHGWTLLQDQPNPGARRTDRIQDDTGDSAILVAPSVGLGHSRTVRMKRLWRVLSHNKVHEPHEYEITHLLIPRMFYGKARKWLPRRRWRLEAVHYPTHGAHGPNGAAWIESAEHSKRWLARGRKGVPSAVVGDVNESKERLQAWFGDRFKVFGKGIDNAVTLGVEACEVKELSKGGGDHHGRHYTMYAA